MEAAIRIEAFTDIQTDKICYWFEKDVWWIYLPKCGVGNLSNHTVVENPDRTITVTPSILLKGHVFVEGINQNLQRHGYITNGEWKEC